jgi:hypothetical protein
MDPVLDIAPWYHQGKSPDCWHRISEWRSSFRELGVYSAKKSPTATVEIVLPKLRAKFEPNTNNSLGLLSSYLRYSASMIKVELLEPTNYSCERRTWDNMRRTVQR